MRFLIMATTVVLLLTVGLMLQRLFQGPTIFARMNGLGLITADTILLIVLFGFLDGQPGMYIDLAIAYAMMGGVPFQEIIAGTLMGLGLIFLLGSLLGMLRLPDFYSRIHAAGNSETMGSMLVLSGLAVYNGFSTTSVKLIIIFLFVFLGNPIASHILAKAAYKTEFPVWTRKNPVGDTPEDDEKLAEKEGEENADLHH